MAVQTTKEADVSTPDFMPNAKGSESVAEATAGSNGKRVTTPPNGDFRLVEKKGLQHVAPQYVPSEATAMENTINTSNLQDSIDPTAILLTGEVVDDMQDEAAMMATELANLQAELQEREGQQIVEAIPVANGSKDRDGNNGSVTRQWRQTWILLVLIVIGAIVAVPVALTSSSSSPSSAISGASDTNTSSPTDLAATRPPTTSPTELIPSGSPSEIPSLNPSDSPSQSPTNSPRTHLLQDLLSTSSFNSTEEWDAHLLASPDSSQARAINWLLNKDEYLPLPMAQANMSFQVILLHERYAAVNLYFATSGGQWETSEDFYLNTTSSVCTWHADTYYNEEGIFCDSDSPNGLVHEVLFVDCMLVGSVPSELALLRNLHTLDLSENILGGSLPSQLGELPSLKFVSLENNYFTGALPPLSSTMISLRLSNNQLSGALPSEWGKMDQLTYMDISADYGMNITIPSEFGLMSQLITLYLGTVQGPLPSEFGNLGNLETLEITISEGTLHTEFCNLGNLSELSYLSLDNVGTIPTEFGLMTSLTALNMDIGGTLPTEFGNLRNLSALVMASNGHSGTIPTELGLLTRLTGLSLASNQFTGTLPSEIGNLVLMEDLYFDGNTLLTGTVPTDYGKLTNLFWISFTNTPGLTGSLDPVFCDGYDNVAIIETHCLYDEVYSLMECSCCAVNHC
eukprot:Nitzschia sp. Nitz4//scaffold214_size40253//4134//6188//NITZ4_007585-RA/size40253-processed-gene-0.3-mRNA-1//1//CDS//3329542093//2847//frame0